INRQYISIPLNDPPTNSDNKYVVKNFNKIFMAIENFINNGKNVLIFCKMGSQRSATIVSIYLMIKYKMNFNAVYNFLKAKQPMVFFGNDNYLDSIKYIENIINKVNQNIK